MFKKKTSKGAFHGPVGETFSQKKKISVSNIKHSGDKKKISLTKPNINEDIYSDMNSEFSNNKLGSTELSLGGAFFLDLAVTTPKAKKVIIDLSLIKAISLTREKRIIINSDLKKQKICSNRIVVIKKISMDTPKKMIVAALAKFGKIKSIKIQLIRLWQKAMVEFAKIGQAVQLAAKWSFLIEKNSV
ncbi:hypothetical protein G9A89_005435 [Geosiphon pyriformis]|nr:hypothetical protein G9A89_005435 [Geosiphon pyriformis]